MGGTHRVGNRDSTAIFPKGKKMFAHNKFLPFVQHFTRNGEFGRKAQELRFESFVSVRDKMACEAMVTQFHIPYKEKIAS